jgi:nitroreductase
MSYANAVQQTWAHRDLSRARDDPTPLVHYATLAASSHNTQPWKFEVSPSTLRIFPDLSRRCPAVDPDDHHLFVSLGCATENLFHAARGGGIHVTARFDPSASCVHLDLEPTSPASSALLLAIPERRSTRARFLERELSVPQLRQLERAGLGAEVEVLLITDPRAKARVSELVVAGNEAQLSDRLWSRELREWMRFNEVEAVRRGDGLYGKLFGVPSLPRWLGLALMPLVATPARQNATDVEHLRSSAALAVFSSRVDDRAHQVEAGRCFQRFALQATAFGLCTAFVNQPVEVPHLRAQLAAELKLGDRRPDLLVRLGYGPPVPHSLRRPLTDVILA